MASGWPRMSVRSYHERKLESCVSQPVGSERVYECDILLPYTTLVILTVVVFCKCNHV